MHPKQYMPASLNIYISSLLKCVDNNLEIHGISFAIDWKEIGLGFINFGASTVVDTLGSWLKRMICTYTSVVYNGSTSLPVFDVWLKRKIGLMCKSIDYGGRSLSLWKVYSSIQVHLILSKGIWHG